jgi:hypothetical protein
MTTFLTTTGILLLCSALGALTLLLVREKKRLEALQNKTNKDKPHAYRTLLTPMNLGAVCFTGLIGSQCLVFASTLGASNMNDIMPLSSASISVSSSSPTSSEEPTRTLTRERPPAR